ncbi:hypothetical protein [Campylobacter avium]|uniref:hypothetical protein n=1 Tax=Campylobacter avium TaxID=522485 RepID=UPI0023553105|nr:hypothetical protein [Campylobacter avium]
MPIKDRNTADIVWTIVLIIDAIPLLYVAWVLLIIFAKILMFACIAFVYPVMWGAENSKRIREDEGILSFKAFLYMLVGLAWGFGVWIPILSWLG